MTVKSLSASELADSIGVQRSNLTHVLNGRNKPSFQFIAKLLETYPDVNAKWLLLGQGSILEDSTQPVKNDLFSDSEDQPAVEPISLEEPIVSSPVKEEESAEYNTVAAFTAGETKHVERIVVFYTDQTFKSYTPSK